MRMRRDVLPDTTPFSVMPTSSSWWFSTSMVRVSTVWLPSVSCAVQRSVVVPTGNMPSEGHAAAVVVSGYVMSSATVFETSPSHTSVATGGSAGAAT